MDGCVLLTSTPKCLVPSRGEALHEGVGINNTHPSKFNPDYNMIPTALVNSSHNYAYDNQIKIWIECNQSLVAKLARKFENKYRPPEMCSTCDLAGPSQYVLSIYDTRRQAGVIVRSEVNLDVEYLIHTVHSNETRESHSTIYTRAWTGWYDFQWGPPDHETGLWSSGRAPVVTMTLVHEIQMWSLRCKHINPRYSMGLKRVPMDYDPIDENISQYIQSHWFVLICLK